MVLRSPYAAAAHMIAKELRRDHWVKYLVGCLAIPYLLISGPFLMAAAPIGFLLSLVENRLPLVWCGLGTLLNLASIGDLATDLGMYIKVLLEYFKSEPTPTPSPFDWPSTLAPLPEVENDDKVFAIRSALMPFGSLFVIVAFFIDKDKDTSKQDQDKEKKPECGVLIFVMLVAAILWKVKLIVVKFYLIATMLFRKDMGAMNTAMLFNLLCLGDLIASGIPLGVLTFLEMHDILFHWNYTYNWEVAKLVLVSINACAASNTMFFQILPGVRRELKSEDSIESTPLNHVTRESPKPSQTQQKQPAPTKKPAPKPAAGKSSIQYPINVAS